MVGVDEHVRVEFEQTRQNLADALVRHLDRLRRGLQVARVADHVAVRVVYDDEPVGVVLQAAEQFVRHVVGVHLGVRGERRGVEARFHLDLVFALGRRRGLAVEETRDVAELLGLREAELADASLRDDLAEEVIHAAARAHRAEQVVLELVPVAREAEERHLRPRTALARIIVAHERLRQLNGAVLTVVRVHDDVAILHARIVANHVAGDVFVGHRRTVGRLTVFIFRLHRLLDRRGLLALAADDAVVGLARERPVLHAIHAVVATHRRADLRIADGGEFLFQAGDVFERRTRRRVAAVEERMNDDTPFGELLTGAAHQLEKVFLMGVNALVLQKPEEVELRVVLLPVLDEVRPLRGLEEFARRKAVVNALQFLNDDASCPHVEVADFGTALIAVGQPDRLAAAVQQTVRITGANLVDDGRLRTVNGVAVLTGVDAPAVANNQNYGSHFILLLSSIVLNC